MDAFATSRLRWFQGRTRELQQLTDFFSLPPQTPRASPSWLPRLDKANPRCWPSSRHSSRFLRHFLITHFVGATERSATAHALVERLLGELDRSGIAWPADEQKEGEEPKRDFNSLCLRLAQRLGRLRGRAPHRDTSRRA